MVCTWVIGLCLISGNPDDTVKIEPCEKEIVRQVNVERQRYGLKPLILDHTILRSTRAHCAWMCSYGMIHSRGPFAENIAMGQDSVSSVMSCWMRSPGHRANILNPGYRYIGAVGYVTRSGSVFWCQQFR